MSPPEPKISPSLLSSDFAHLADESNRMLALGAEWLHVDVMDGHFVPNLTLGAPIVKSLRKHTSGFLDCHLMVTDPEKWISDFANAGANMYTFHVETLLSKTSSPSPSEPAVSTLLAQLLSKVKSNKMMTGVAIKPSTPLEPWLPVLEPFILSKDLDMVLIMTVEPGFGGQSFMSSVMPKVTALRSKFPDLDIEVDGGLNLETVKEAADAGANVIVAGSSIFGSKDPGAVIKGLRDSVIQASAHW